MLHSLYSCQALCKLQLDVPSLLLCYHPNFLHLGQRKGTRVNGDISHQGRWKALGASREMNTQGSSRLHT